MSVPLQDNVPSPTYRMGFAAAPLDPQAGIAWTDITTFTPTDDGIQRLRVLSRTSEAGKKDAQTTVDTSRGVYTVDNRDGAFTPLNSASPYYPNIRLGVIFQELQTWAGNTYAVFTGFVDDYNIEADDLGRPVVIISCSDAQKLFQLTQLEGSMWDIEIRKDVSANIAAGRNTVWQRLNDPSNSPVAKDYGGQGWDGDYQNGPILGVKSLIAGSTDTCMDVAHSSDQRLVLPYPDIITGFPFTVEAVFRVQQARSASRGIVVAYDDIVSQTQILQIIIDSTSGGHPGQVFTEMRNGSQVRSAYSSITVDDFVVHHLIVVYASASSVAIWIDGSDFTVMEGTGTPTFPPNLSTGYAIANTPPLPAADFGLDAGASVDQFGNEIDGGLQSVAIYDGLALSTDRIRTHAQAAIVGWGSVTIGSRIEQLLDALGWPTADRAIESGKTVVPNVVSGSTPLDYLQLLAQTEGGRFFVGPEGYPTFHGRNHPLTNPSSTTAQAIFDDSGASGSIPYVPPFEPHLDDIGLYSRASVTRLNGTPQVYDATPGSTSSRILTKSGLLMATDDEARSMARHDAIVAQRNSLRLRSLVFFPQAAPTLGWPAALGLRQGDRVKVNRHWEDGSAWSADWIVEGISHHAESAENWWTVTLLLSPVDLGPYFMLDSSLLDSGKLLFY